jgi:uncharacterized protein
VIDLPDEEMRELLAHARVIAVVGHSDNIMRTSYQIGFMLRQAGFVVYPVNPNIEKIDGHRCYPNLAAVPEKIDIVDVFRRAEFLDGVVDEAIAVGAKAVWGQFGVIDEAAGEKARAAGLKVVMDRCIKIEYYRLLGQ